MVGKLCLSVTVHLNLTEQVKFLEYKVQPLKYLGRGAMSVTDWNTLTKVDE